MRPSPWIRRSLKWGGLGAALVLTLTWGLSQGWGVRCADRAGNAIGAGSGVVWVYLRDSGAPVRLPDSGFSLRSRPGYQFHWWFRFDRTSPFLYIWVPIWVLVLLAGGAGALGWRLDAKAREPDRVECCKKCGYDCRGLPEGVGCPECGASGEGESGR